MEGRETAEKTMYLIRKQKFLRARGGVESGER